MEKLKDLNDLKLGFDKHWPLKDKDSYHLIFDYLQKINFCIQDINTEIKNNDEYKMKDIIFILVQVTWIQDSLDAIKKLYKEDVTGNYRYSLEEKLRAYKSYIRAMRSFMVAHPLNTNRHEEYGFDGDLICMDIGKPNILLPLWKTKNIYHIGIDGLENICVKTDKLFMSVYSHKNDKSRYNKFIGFSLDDIIDAARIYIDELYEFEKYMRKQKKAFYQ